MAFKAQDASGTGKTIPLSFMPGSWCGDIVDLIAALGGTPDNMDHRIVQDDKVIFTATQDGYKKAIQTLHEWYKEGLIDPESFSQDDKAYLAKGKAATENLGSFVWWEIHEMVGADRAGDYAWCPSLRRPRQANRQPVQQPGNRTRRIRHHPGQQIPGSHHALGRQPVRSHPVSPGQLGDPLVRPSRRTPAAS